MKCWYNVITLVVILNWNQSLIKELHKKIQRYGNIEETHNSNWTKIRIFVCTCINIKKWEFSLLHLARIIFEWILNLCIYTKLSQLKTVGLLIMKIKYICIRQQYVKYDDLVWGSPLSLHLLGKKMSIFFYCNKVIFFSNWWLALFNSFVIFSHTIWLLQF